MGGREKWAVRKGFYEARHPCICFSVEHIDNVVACGNLCYENEVELFVALSVTSVSLAAKRVEENDLGQLTEAGRGMLGRSASQ